MGIALNQSEKTIDYSLPGPIPASNKRQNSDIVYLSGFGPRKILFGKQRTICEKEIVFRVNRKLHEKETIWIHLFSPFEFKKWYWYGDYSQKVQVLQNGEFLTEIELQDGENAINLDLRRYPLKNSNRIMNLKFKYISPFEFARTWKVSVLLDGIEIKQKAPIP